MDPAWQAFWEEFHCLRLAKGMLFRPVLKPKDTPLSSYLPVTESWGYYHAMSSLRRPERQPNERTTRSWTRYFNNSSRRRRQMGKTRFWLIMQDVRRHTEISEEGLLEWKMARGNALSMPNKQWPLGFRRKGAAILYWNSTSVYTKLM